MTTWPFVPTRPVILVEYNDLEARYGAFGPPVSVRERIPIRHKITEAETAPGLVGGFRYVPPQDLVPDWPATDDRQVPPAADGLSRGWVGGPAVGSAAVDGRRCGWRPPTRG